MRLEQISYFLCVAEYRNITVAAKNLYISQPALSKQIALLEKELGVPLLERKARGISLTEAGLQFEKDLKNILKELENAKQNAVIAGQAKKPLLNIGCFDGAYIEDFLPPLYEYLKEAASDQKLVLHKCSFLEGRDDIKKGKIDLWLTLSQAWEDTNEYASKILVNRRGALIYSVRSASGKLENPVFEDFRNEPCVLVKKSICPGLFQHAMNTLDALDLDPASIEIVDNIGTQISYVKLGRGYCFLSENVAQNDRVLKKMLLPKQLGLTVIAVWKKENERVTALMEEYGK